MEDSLVSFKGQVKAYVCGSMEGTYGFGNNKAKNKVLVENLLKKSNFTYWVGHLEYNFGIADHFIVSIK